MVCGFAGLRVSQLNRQTNKGFTLVELLVTASILMMIGAAIVSSFAGGLKVHESVRDFGRVRGDVLLSLEKLERDLRNIPRISTIGFNGEKGEVSFAGLVTVVDTDGESNTSLGRILYYLDGKKKLLVKEEQGYSQGILDIKKKKGRISELAPIEGIGFKYYYYDPEFDTYTWKDSWKLKEEGEEEEEKEEDILLGVKVEVKFNDRGEEVAFVRTVFMPTAEKPAVQ
ncbi:MAG: prepilin-type N-terminal cleavage/methylation domain-containing protein [Candidatus Omnitrophica bacterium]|nr:prepilin-type N-terminal cleavage/methylation domain-containing protein [Candidatus Omnitrophota bacterium]